MKKGSLAPLLLITALAGCGNEPACNLEDKADQVIALQDERDRLTDQALRAIIAGNQSEAQYYILSIEELIPATSSARENYEKEKERC